MKQPTITRRALMKALASALVSGVMVVPIPATADEGGVSFWLPGFFGSLAAAPQQPGWSLTNIYYHTSVSAGGDVALAREFEIKRVPGNLSASAAATFSGNLNATGDLGIVMPPFTAP